MSKLAVNAVNESAMKIILKRNEGQPDPSSELHMFNSLSWRKYKN